MANTVNFDRWGRPAWTSRHQDDLESRQDSWRPGWHPGLIVLMVAGFIVWWPLGLGILAYTLWSRNMGCSHNRSRFGEKIERMQAKMERMYGRMESGFYTSSSGNRAFDEYRMETLRRLEEEQAEFKDFLDRLRHAKDKEEFDQFMAQHRQRPAPQNDQPQG